MSVLPHLPLVRSIAYRLSRRAPRFEVDDLVSAGTIGLIQAVDRFDSTVGVPFGSFAYRRIAGAIIDEIHQLDASTPGDLETARSLPLSLEAPVGEDDGLTLMDVTVDPFALEPDTHAQLGELLDAIERLPPRERQMLRLSTAGHTLSEIAVLHDCSHSRVSQLLGQARLRLEERTAA
jgi:RNA polymerase sigma factor for flagellar operon FliA